MTKVTHIDNKKQHHASHDADESHRAFVEHLATNRALNRLYAKSPLDDTDAVIFDGGVKTVLVRKPIDNELCVVDWLNIVIDAGQLRKKFVVDDEYLLNDYEQDTYVVNQISSKLFSIIGFGVDYEQETGRNFYSRCFVLEHKTGFVCIGGQGGSVLIMINGTGCNYANLAWETSMFNWLSSLSDVRISRIDLAHDVLDKSFINIDLFNDLHSKGGFAKGGRNPDVEHRGNWKAPNGKGRTLYIGSRQSSKFCRIYEKGKQLGDNLSQWLRIEVEFKSRDIFIPLSVLLNPTDYFIASYPCFSVIEENGYLDKYDTRDKSELLTFEKAFDIAKKQYGRYINFFRQVYKDDALLLDELTDVSDKSTPKKLDVLTIPRRFNTPLSLPPADIVDEGYTKNPDED